MPAFSIMPAVRPRLFLPVLAICGLLAMPAADAGATKSRKHESSAVSAITRDLDGDGHIDAIDLRGRGLNVAAGQVRVDGYKILGVVREAAGYRILLAPRTRFDTGVRPQVFLGGEKLTAADGAPPVVVGLTTQDTHRTGHIDDIRVILSEPPALRGLASAFTVAQYAIRSAQAHGTEVDLHLVPHSTYDTGQRPAVTVLHLDDVARNRAPRSTMTPRDGAPPIMIAATTSQLDGSGKIDAVDLMLSEPVLVRTGAVGVSGYQVTGTHDYPNGLLTVFLNGGPRTSEVSAPVVHLTGSGVTDSAGNRGPTGSFQTTLTAPPMMVGARDEGFWLNGEKIVTVWSSPVRASNAGTGTAFDMTTALGAHIPAQGIGPGDAPNEIAVDLPIGAETPSTIAYSAPIGSPVVDATGHPAVTSATLPVSQPSPQFAGTVTDPIDPTYITSFGQRSFWLQPWRSYMDTFPATRMLNAVGINFNVTDSDANQVVQGARLLHDAGFTHARIGIPWNDMSYTNPSQLGSYYVGVLTTELTAFKTNGIRPLILLDANDGIPCPVQPVTLNLTAPAAAGATTVQLDSASAALVQPGLTGFHQYGRDAGVIITSVDSYGNATLSQPLQSALPAGPQAAVDLAFQPFFPQYNSDGSANTTNQATLAGWLQYVAGVTQTAKNILGNDDFDVEIWNELSFGSAFLSASNYYNPAPQGSNDAIGEIRQATVNYIRNPANGLSDVGIGDGFTNEEPWTGGSSETPGITAMDKHPYEGAMSFPAQVTYDGNSPLDGLGAVDGSVQNGQWHDTFVPSFTSLFPEYFLSDIQTENLDRDLAPFLSDIDGGLHGRTAHPPGAAAPQMWVTEVNADASSIGEKLTTADGTSSSPMSAADLRHFETKAILRYLSAWVGKGVTQIDFFAAANAGTLNVVDPTFWSTADQTHSYPGLAAGGETMVAVRRFLDTMAGAQDLTQTRPLTLQAISDYDGAYQFPGNGTAAYPPLYNRDVVGVFPFQVNSNKWVIPTYVMTRDLATLYNPQAPATDPTRQDLPQEVFRFTLGGVNPATVTAAATDPITGQVVPVKITGRGASSVSLEIPLTDYPRMLTLTDG